MNYKINHYEQQQIDYNVFIAYISVKIKVIHYLLGRLYDFFLTDFIDSVHHCISMQADFQYIIIK